MHRWKKRCHLSALKPDRQSQYRKEQLQNPVKHIQFSPGKCLRDQIGSKPAVPSVPRQKKEHRQWDRHKADSLVWIFQYVSHKLFYFLQKHRKQPSRQTEQDSKRIRYVTVFVSVNDRVCERRTENFSSPSACEVADAVKDAIAAGSNAEYAILPLTTTSIAKRLLQTESERGLQIRLPFPQSILSCRCPGSGICGQTHGKVWHRSARQRPRAPHFRQTDV